jgi:NADH:ubiquinone oxidoreductase subunit 3 (subunit A)
MLTMLMLTMLMLVLMLMLMLTMLMLTMLMLTMIGAKKQVQRKNSRHCCAEVKGIVQG